MGIITRPARREDLPRVNELRRQVNELHVEGRPDIFRPGFGEEIEGRAALMLDSGDAEILVAELDGVVCGFAMVEYVDRPESPYNLARRYSHVAEFGVDAAFRRRGVATALMDAVRDDARARGFSRIELDVWAFNRDAVAFYDNYGFRLYRRFLELNLTDET